MEMSAVWSFCEFHLYDTVSEVAMENEMVELRGEERRLRRVPERLETSLL